MPASNRNRYPDDFGGGSSAVRTLGAFLLCAVLSFALGFFVLARFWSNKPKADGENLEKNQVASAGDRSSNRHGDDTPISQRTALPPAQPTPHAAPPRIDPEEDVQKPTSVDEQADTKKSSSGDDVPAQNDASQKDNQEKDPAKDPAENKKTDDTPKSPEKSPAAAPAATDDTRPKRHKKPVADEDAQPSKSPDDESLRQESTDDVNDMHVNRRKRPARTEPPTNGGLYRVQIGVYSTREKAEEEAKMASDKGFETTIHTVPNGDRTLYRVQHSAHRTRNGAETEKQRLVDAGFDAYIANP